MGRRARSGWFSPNSRLAADYIKSHARRVADIMTRELVSVGELATLGKIADLPETKRIKRVPVVTVPRRCRIARVAEVWLPKIVSGMARMPRWAILALRCLTC